MADHFNIVVVTQKVSFDFLPDFVNGTFGDIDIAKIVLLF